jgi:hypothetical protein
MPLTLACPSCGKQFTVPDSAAGKRGRCPSCSTELQIPGIPPPEAPPEPSPEDSDLATAPPGETKECPYCSEAILESARKCRHCGEYLDRELRRTAGRDRRQSVAARAAVAKARKDANTAFILSLVGIFCFGFILEPLAIYQGYQAAKELKRHGSTDGVGLATAAQVIGWIMLGLTVLYVVLVVLGETM